MEIPELAYCVTDGETAKGHSIYYVNYNDMFVVNVAAVKEVDATVTNKQAATIAAIEARLVALGEK